MKVFHRLIFFLHSNHFVSFFRFSIWNFADWSFNTDATCFVTEEYIRCMGWAPYVVTFPDTVLCSLLRPVRHVSVRTFLCMDASSVLRINCRFIVVGKLKRSVMSACGAAWRLLNERSSRVSVVMWLSVWGYPDYFLFSAGAVYCL